MASPEFGGAKLKNILRVGALAMLASCSSALAPEISVTTDGHVLNVEGQASIVPYPNDTFFIVDSPGGLPAEASIAKGKRYLENVGCKIIDARKEKVKGKTIGEYVLVEKSCLPQLK